MGRVTENRREIRNGTKSHDLANPSVILKYDRGNERGNNSTECRQIDTSWGNTLVSLTMAVMRLVTAFVLQRMCQAV